MPITERTMFYHLDTFELDEEEQIIKCNYCEVPFESYEEINYNFHKSICRCRLRLCGSCNERHEKI